jgi:molecular chaperone HtpG
MQRGNISVQTENIFPIIKKFLYSDQEIFLRELISNAVDATTKLQTFSRRGELNGETGEVTIDIILDENNNTLTIRDRGIGMTEEEVMKYLNQVAFSSAQEFIDQYKDDASIIGHFGLGFYSAFMVATKVEVDTLSWKEGSTAVLWSCDGSPEYTLSEGSRKERGTDIILHIGDDSKEYLEKKRIDDLLEKYCKFLPIPIRFGKKDESKTEGEGEDAKTETIQVDNFINNTQPIWKKLPADLSDEDYRSFYRELYPMSYETPLFWIHLNIDFPFNLTGVLYFPHLGNNIEIQRNKIQLYSNQVYVTDNVKEIVPEFLTLLHGVIDSPDIPLNVSRSYLQADSNVKKITGYITRKVADKLSDLFNNERENYESKWNDLSIFVKYGMISDEKFYEKATSFALFKTLESKYKTVDEYIESVKTLQTDKHNKIILIYSNDKDAQYAQIQAAKNNGYDVLMMDQVIDAHFMQQLEYKQGTVTFVRVDSDTVDNLVQKEDKKESVLSEDQEKQIKEWFTANLNDPMSTLVTKALNPDDLPVQITRPEFMRRMKEMQMMQGMKMDGFPDSINVVVNTNHKIINEQILNQSDESVRNETMKYLIQLAKLQSGMLTGAELNAFVNKSIENI